MKAGLKKPDPGLAFRGQAALSRRGLLLGAGGVLLSDAPRIVADAATPAAAFVESVGVCAHVGREPYNSPLFHDLIVASGIRHLRVLLDVSTDFAQWRHLYAAFGIHSHLIVSPAVNTVAQLLDYLNRVEPGSVAAVEGQNEGDNGIFAAQEAVNGGWNAVVVRYQREVFEALRQRYSAAALPIVSPTLIDWKPADVALIRDAAPFCDIVGLHAYVQHGEEPETQDDYAALSWYISNFADSFKPHAPVMVTETGYTNVVAPGQAGVSELAASIYLPRMLLHNFASGVLRTFLYEFMDGGLNPTDGEHHYGIVHFDGTPKDAYHTIAALLVTLADRPGTGARSLPERAIPLAFSNAPADLRHLIFTRSDATVVVALWRPLRVWNVERGEDIPDATRDLLIVPGWSVARAEYMVLARTPVWNTLPVVAGRIEIPVGAAVTLVRLGIRDV